MDGNMKVVKQADLSFGRVVYARDSIQTGQIDIVHVELSRPIIPEEAKLLSEQVGQMVESGQKLLVISGRMPIWAYAMIIHELVHKYAALAVYDPKLEGAVVIASHHQDYHTGQLIKIKL